MRRKDEPGSSDKPGSWYLTEGRSWKWTAEAPETPGPGHSERPHSLSGHGMQADPHAGTASTGRSQELFHCFTHSFPQRGFMGFLPATDIQNNGKKRNVHTVGFTPWIYLAGAEQKHWSDRSVLTQLKSCTDQTDQPRPKRLRWKVEPILEKTRTFPTAVKLSS